MNDKLLSLLGMCRRAGKLAPGFEKAAEAIEKHKAALILIASDTAPRTEKEIRFKSDNSVTVIRLTVNRETLSHAIGTSAGTVAVTDEGFATQAKLLIHQGGTTL